MNRNALTFGNITDNIITPYRRLAAGELNQTVVQSLHHDSVYGMGLDLGLRGLAHLHGVWRSEDVATQRQNAPQKRDNVSEGRFASAIEKY